MKSKNIRISSVYNYILKHKDEDGDFWCLGTSGSKEIQNRLNDFTKEDWIDLKLEIFNWSEIYRGVLLDSIPYGFDGMFTPHLDEKVIPDAVNFLLDMFILIDDIDVRFDIAYFSIFINRSNTKHIEKLKFMKNWMLENGFNSEEWIKSPINPIKNIDEAIEKASL